MLSSKLPAHIRWSLENIATAYLSSNNMPDTNNACKLRLELQHKKLRNSATLRSISFWTYTRWPADIMTIAQISHALAKLTTAHIS
jgi:hypothetical protein